MDTTGSEGIRRERLDETLSRIEREQRSTSRSASNEGPWVVVATLGHARLRGIAQLRRAHGCAVHEMQHYATAELAMAGAQEHGAVRVAGGWALNLETGATVRIRATRNTV